MGRPFEVVELTASERPPEHQADQKDQHEAQRDEEIEDVHGSSGQRRETRGERVLSFAPVRFAHCAVHLSPLACCLSPASVRRDALLECGPE